MANDPSPGQDPKGSAFFAMPNPADPRMPTSPKPCFEGVVNNFRYSVAQVNGRTTGRLELVIRLYRDPKHRTPKDPTTAPELLYVATLWGATADRLRGKLRGQMGIRVWGYPYLPHWQDAKTGQVRTGTMIALAEPSVDERSLDTALDELPPM